MPRRKKDWPALPESENTAAEAAKRWANKALGKALSEHVKAQEYLKGAERKVDECLRNIASRLRYAPGEAPRTPQ